MLKTFFYIFYRNANIPTSCTAKYRRVGEQWISNSESAAKKNMENYHTHQLCISKKKFYNAVLLKKKYINGTYLHENLSPMNILPFLFSLTISILTAIVFHGDIV